VVTAGGSIIFADVAYTYKSVTAKYVIGRFYLDPRKAAQIARRPTVLIRGTG
jgi:hypothetical protein